MYSKAKIGTHAIHPILVAFPIVFSVMTFVSFLVYQSVSSDPFWYKMAYFNNMAYIVAAVLAAIPGFIDWAMGIPRDTAAKSRGLVHMGLNVLALGLFIWNAFLIAGTWDLPPADVTMSTIITLIGVGLIAPAGYHGFHLLATHKVGVNLTPEQERLEPVREMDPREHVVSHPSPSRA